MHNADERWKCLWRNSKGSLLEKGAHILALTMIMLTTCMSRMAHQIWAQTQTLMLSLSPLSSSPRSISLAVQNGSQVDLAVTISTLESPIQLITPCSVNSWRTRGHSRILLTTLQLEETVLSWWHAGVVPRVGSFAVSQIPLQLFLSHHW